MAEEIKPILESLIQPDTQKIILSNPNTSDAPFRKLVYTKKQIKGKLCYQLEKFTQKQVFHDTVIPDELAADTAKWMTTFRQVDLFSSTETICVKQSKKGKIFVGKSQMVSTSPKSVSGSANSQNASNPNLEHNRKKQYLIPEGEPIAPLYDLGVFTQEGYVSAGMYDKYKQINRFIEIIDDALRGKQWGQLRVIDFGCGKLYLTFVLYHFLTQIKHIPVHMTGLDLKEDVILHCQQTAQKYGYEGLDFAAGDIASYQKEESTDMVVALHACDTATDAALCGAVLRGAKMIFSVPCCQHELNAQMESGDFSLLTRYGIIQERTAALMTDAIRANLLTAAGYRTQLLEFVDLTHSPKNILIRAVRASVPQKKRQEALAEVLRLTETFHFNPSLLRLFREKGIL